MTSLGDTGRLGAPGAFDVSATGSAMGDPDVPASTLGISVLDITQGATMAQPAVGKVSFLSPQTQNDEYASSACQFYFSSANEGVGDGKVWVTFACPTFIDGQLQSTCEIRRATRSSRTAPRGSRRRAGVRTCAPTRWAP